ncbi:MAG: hypothetical protein QOJ99_6137 [Bryobacterales bacterium]|nr:hypothetical protein [Bryobacterales bacterium]
MAVRVWCATHRCVVAPDLPAQFRRLEDFREFRCEGTLWFLIPLLTSAAIGAIALFRSGTRTSRGRSTRTTLGSDALCGLRRVGPKNFVLEWCTVETANNRLHFVRSGGLYESEAFRLLRFMIPDDLNRIRDKIFSCEPLFNVVSCDPSGQITQKDGKAHSVT